MPGTEAEVAALGAAFNAHEKLDDERFGRIVADVRDIKDAQARATDQYNAGIGRVHKRVDEAVTQLGDLKSAVTEVGEKAQAAVTAVGLQAEAAIKNASKSNKIWALSNAVLVLLAIAGWALNEALGKG